MRLTQLLPNIFTLQKKILLFLSRNIGIAIGLCSLLLAGVFSMFPWFAEIIYRKGCFQVVRLIVDFSIALLPFPTIYLLLILIPFLLFFYFKRSSFHLRSLFFVLLNFMGWMAFFFLLMWGYNYTCDKKVLVQYSRTMSLQDLYHFGQEMVKETNQSRHQVEGIQFEFDDNELRSCVENYCQKKGLPILGRVQCKEIFLNGLMRKAGVAGIYMPFTGESYCDGTFPSVVKVFIKAHEMSHGYGVTDEGEADFFAFNALLLQEENKDFAYAANLELLRSIRSQLQRNSDSLRRELDTQLSSEVIKDIVSIRIDALKYQEYIPGLQAEFNDKYLKIMGIHEGVQSYDRFVELVWHNWNPHH